MKLPALTLASPLMLATALCGQNPTYWTTYFGGSGQDAVDQVVAAANGDILIAGTTESSDLPVPPTAFQTSSAGLQDVFVARLSADGTGILAATYLAGTRRDVVYDLVEGGDGSVWLTGKSDSTDFPTTTDAFTVPAGTSNFAFVAQFDAGLTTLLFASALGTNANTEGRRLALDDANQHVLIAGLTGGALFPTTPSAFQSTVSGKAAFLSVLDRSAPGTTTLAYSTTVNGNSFEKDVLGLTLDAAGIATISGTTSSTDFPTTLGALATSSAGSNDGFVVRIDPSQSGASSLIYGTYIGGTGYEESIAHGVDAAGTVHLVLASQSSDLPVTANALQPTANQGLDVYYAQLDPTLAGAAALRYGSWIIAGDGTDGQGVGNAAHDNCAEIALASGKAIVWATSSSPAGIATTPGAFQPATSVRRGHAVVLDLAGVNPVVAYASSFVGCSQNIFTGEVAVHPSGDLLLTGWGDSVPVTAAAAQPQGAGMMDGYVSRLAPTPWPPAVRVLGTSCSGTAGTPTFSAVAPPRMCKRMLLEANGLPPNRIGAVSFGDGATYGGQPLPLSLAPIGGGSCMLHAGPVAVLPSSSNGTGVASVGFGVPFDIMLVEWRFAMQFLCIDPGANQLGLITTNGLELEVRW